MSALLDALDKLDDNHDCPMTHRTSTDDESFSSYTCPACIPLVSEIIQRHKPDVTIMTTRQTSYPSVTEEPDGP